MLLILDEVKHDRHKLSPHRVTVLGECTPELFNRAVIKAFNSASTTGSANILYSAKLTPAGNISLVAKLYQVKRNKIGKKQYKMFATFHHPDGEQLRIQAKVSKLFERSDKSYPSRPVYNPNVPTRLKKTIRSKKVSTRKPTATPKLPQSIIQPRKAAR